MPGGEVQRKLEKGRQRILGVGRHRAKQGTAIGHATRRSERSQTLVGNAESKLVRSPEVQVVDVQSFAKYAKAYCNEKCLL